VTTRDRFLREYPRAVADDAAAVFVGAGVSVGAGYPSWKDLLHEIGEELGVSSGDVSDLAALAQWSIRRASGKTRILQVIRDKIAVQRAVPPPLNILARLPIRNIWTTNYDRLIERAFEAIGRPIEPISSAADLAIRARPGAARLYKMHGTVDRLDDLVIATDDYELYRTQRGAFLPLLQAHMTSMSMLFIGLSFTDPNVRHVLSVIRESFAASPPEHFAIVRPPHRDEFASDAEFKSKLTQHDLWSDDLKRYGLQVVEIDSYDEVPALLRDVERRVAASRIWVSGSWPPEDDRAIDVSNVAHAVGKAIASADFALVSGSGLTVMPNTVAGFLETLQLNGSWDLERRLLVRPFPQAVVGAQPNRAQWTALRAEMARISGAVVFIGGAKLVDGKLVDAEGVVDERRAAESAGVFLLPIGSTGGMAESICRSLIGSNIASRGARAMRPTDAELKALLAPKTPTEIASSVVKILTRQRGAYT
jgi:hypothetical protein